MKKRILSVLLAAAMLSTLLAGCEKKPEASADSTAAADGDVVRIGVFEPASGDNGAGGKQETLGIQYANYVTPTVEIGGKEYTVQLDIVDNESSNDKAPTAAATLVSNGVSVVLGSYGSGVSIAGSDTFKEAGIPVIGVTCTNPQITEGNTHYFRICFLDPFQGTVLANFAKDNFSAQKAYVLTKLGDDYSTGLGYYFTEAFEALGGEVVSDTFQEGNSDFTSYITSAKNEGADVFFAPSSTEVAALLVEQAASQGLEIPLLAGDTWDSNVILNAAEGKNVDIYVSTFYQEGGNPEFDAGIKEWINSDSTAKANNGGDDTVSGLTVMGYDAYYVALEALKAAGSTDPAAVNEALWDVTYTGVSGDISFNEIGDANRDAAYIKHANTETAAWDFVAEQSVAE
ncbi:amino acid ABC transporter substrate-binding protein [Lachnoclostridium sp. An131]|jgi:branched-chain amino acid transport system substrate-binding protein|uniref:ABC transporter substrate-binding protein n=1 Tax=Lachnoclostridium sp. An131 TaxID=1965555 RepID=UPI000B389B5D|nr:ABC transporter substrate-binding protein [Lachnoclostridium sp. An131]OUQ26244.1 amino acid ABC transporter substrate-binding protein [Lachnoclostridium sp. An131]